MKNTNLEGTKLKKKYYIRDQNKVLIFKNLYQHFKYKPGPRASVSVAQNFIHRYLKKDSYKHSIFLPNQA